MEQILVPDVSAKIRRLVAGQLNIDENLILESSPGIGYVGATIWYL